MNRIKINGKLGFRKKANYVAKISIGTRDIYVPLYHTDRNKAVLELIDQLDYEDLKLANLGLITILSRFELMGICYRINKSLYYNVVYYAEIGVVENERIINK